ncbi:MAG TPA: uracil phosphoribosyltransferase [Candidatus Gastranaerophilales bacterium]|nr:uracil phosphoribosyltransferase [Candidatus Gastranaerophilales bacterium]
MNIAPNVCICNTPLVTHNISILRDKTTSSETFRATVKRVSSILVNKAFENIPLATKEIETPLMKTNAGVIDSNAKFIIAPILRAGLIFSEVAMDILPVAKVHHIGLYRDEETLKPVPYYNNLPENFSNPPTTYVYIFDPMLATGGSAVAAVKLFNNLNIAEENITFISLIAAPEGISRLSSEFKNIKIITGALDKKLNEVGYILPGLGDAGDRTFNTF